MKTRFYSSPLSILFFFAIFSCIFQESTFAQLNGTYTIGGNNPDYATFQAAANDLATLGVSGTVIFNVRTGVYNEKVVLPVINGTSDTSPVIFQSEVEDSTQVLLTSVGNVDSSFVLQFNGADWVTFQKMALEGTDPTYGRVVEVTNGSDNISLKNNIINGVSTASNSNLMALVYSSDTMLFEMNFLLENNVLLHGSYGVLWEESEPASTNMVIRNNVLSYQSWGAISVHFQDGVLIDKNNITTNFINAGYSGIYLNQCNHAIQVTKNQVVDVDGGIGIYLDTVFGDFINPALVANNFVQMGGTSLVGGIVSTNGEYQTYVHNSILLTNTHTESSAIFALNASFNVSMFNNIFHNDGNGYSLFLTGIQFRPESEEAFASPGLQDNSAFISSDYNNLYSKGNFLVFWFTNFTSLVDWQTNGLSSDFNSVSVPSIFYAPQNFHVANSALNEKGTFNPLVTTDLDGQLRDTQFPDIGADEFILGALDAGITEIDVPNAPFSSGAQTLRATIQNHGFTTLTNATVNWKFNGMLQPAINWSGNLAQGDTTSVALGAGGFLSNQNNNVISWTSMPNGASDVLPFNDTLGVFNLYPALSGTFTIGGSMPDFPTFAAATQILQGAGVSGAVTFKVRDGTYNEQISIGPIAGASASNIITFESESGDSSQVILTHAATTADANYTLKLNGTDWVGFRKMTLEATGNPYGRVVEIANGAMNNYFEGNWFKSIVNAATNEEASIIWSAGDGEAVDNLYFSNLFENGSVGIYLNNEYFLEETGTLIVNNTFENQSHRALHLKGQAGSLLFGNTITSNATNNTYIGILLENCNSSTHILQNSLSQTDGASNLTLNNCAAAAMNEGLIANNFMQKGGSSPTNSISLNNCSYFKFYHNNIHVDNNDLATTALELLNGIYLDIWNNNIYNSGFGRVIFSNSNSNIQTADHNNLITTGSTLGVYGGNSYTDFAAWQAGTTFDANGFSENPNYVSNTDLHITNFNLDGVAAPLPEIGVDIDGFIRDPVSPDIGADEISNAALDVGVFSIDSPSKPFAAASQDIYVSLGNYGIETLQSATIEWEVNGIAQTTANWAGSLAVGTLEDSVNIGSFIFQENVNYEIRAWTDSPNGMVDLKMSNDTATVNNLSAALSGIYTVGGTMPDFLDFQEAVDALINRGIAGTVTFNVRNGTYTEQLVLPEILGANTTTPIIFQSESGDSTAVVLTFNATNTSNNYVLKLDGGDCFHFKKMTIQNTGNAYARIVEIANGATNNLFESNEIIGKTTTNTSANYALIYSGSWKDDNNIFRYNWLQNGSYGIFGYGQNTPNEESGTVVQGNRFENQYYRALHFWYQDAPLIASNEITAHPFCHSSYYGIYVVNSKNGTQVLKNHLYNIRNGRGIYLASIEGTGSNQGLIANNFVQVGDGTSSTDYGIYLFNTDHHHIYHNNIHLKTSTSNAYAFYATSCQEVNVKNNIFYTSDDGRAFYENSSTNLLSDYNNFYITNGSTLGFWKGSTAANLSEWQSISGQDANGKSIPPQYISDTDLHIEAVALNQAGTPVNEVTDDFDGDLRNALFPSIGADEFAVAADDAGILSIDSPTIPFPASNQNIDVSLINGGSDTLQSVTIQWELNGTAQPPINWTGILQPGGIEDSLTLTAINFEIDTAYSIRAWATNPNGVMDTHPANDTAEVHNLYASLSGVYTIGGINPDFPNFTAAVNTLINGGVLGSVTFNVRTGTYDEQVSIPEIMGVDSLNTITFQSEVGDSTQVTLEYTSPTSSNNFVLKLDGADWVIFQEMTLKNEHTNYGRVLDIRNAATHNLFQHNQLIGRDITTTSSNHALVYSSDWNDDYNTFSHNRFLESSYGFYYFGDNTVNLEKGTIINHNSFEGQVYRTIFLPNQDAPYIGYNKITSDFAYNFSSIIHTVSSKNATTIVHNYIWNIPDGSGIVLELTDGTSSDYALVANNFVHLGLNSHTNSINGILNENSDFVKIYHNNVHIYGNSSDSYAFYNTNSNDVLVKNNIFASTNKGRAYYKNGGSNLISDYNDLYSADTHIGYWQGSDITNLATWQATSGLEANSYAVHPNYASTTDLHVDVFELNKTGTPLPEVTDDFDGEPRDPAMPDIGADEFFPMVMHDASVIAIATPLKGSPFPEGVQPVEVVIKNNGIDTLLNVTVEWKANNLPQLAYNWTGFILPGALDTVTIGAHNFILGFGTDLEANTKNPNGVSDNNPGNDTSKVLNLYPGLSGVYTIGGAFPNFGNFGAAATSLNEGGVLGQVTFLVRNGVYTEQITLEEIVGASSTNHITFVSEAGDSTLVKMEHSNGFSNNYLVRLNGTDYVTFQKMTFRALHTTYATIFEFVNGADYNKILNNDLVDVGLASDELIFGSHTSLDNFNLIQNNRFEGGGRAISFNGQGTSSLESGNQFVNNILENQNTQGISLSYQDAPIVKNNEISTNSTHNNYFGIGCSWCDNEMRIMNNRVSGGFGTGMYLYRCDAPASDSSLVANNFIQVGGNNLAYGIRTISGVYQNIYHNSVHITNSDPASMAFYNLGNSVAKNILNNNFTNTGGGLAVYIGTSTGINELNKNNYYTTGTNLGYWKGSFAIDLLTWQGLTGKDVHSIAANPLYYSEADLHVLQVALDSAAMPIAGVLKDIDGEPRNSTHPDIGADEFDFLEDDLGIIAFLSPIENCDLTNAEIVKVVIQNYGGLPQTGFDISYGFVNGSSVTENVGSLVVQPGDTTHFTFATPVDLSNHLTYVLESTTLLAGDLNPLNDGIMTTVQNHQTPVPVGNMLPSDGSIDIDVPINFSWLPAAGAIHYDLYLWEENAPTPTMPVGQDLEQITFVYNDNTLIFGATYNWQVVSKNDFCETAGPIQSFTLRELPDLVVNTVGVPNTAFSEQMIEVTWEVSNTAIGNTGMATWYDYIYLSTDNIYQPNIDIYLGGFANLTALNSMQSYSQMKMVTLPQGIEGTYHIFVITDKNNQVIEGNNDNNVSATASMLVTLTPPPDLRVTSILTPNNAFSNTMIDVTWTVLNGGAGNVQSTFLDRIYLSDQAVFSQANAVFLATESGSPILAGNSYTKTRSITLPQEIFGDYYIHVVTDYFNQVYEHVFEDNNVKTSDTMNIILTPPPDLIVTNISPPDSVNNKEEIALQWVVKNQGATVTDKGFNERIYLSSHPVFDPDSVMLLETTWIPNFIGAGDSLTTSRQIEIPNSICGTQYIYIQVDAFNNIFEFDKEDNNRTRSDSFFVKNTDLIVTEVLLPDSVFSGKNLTVQWIVKNEGIGDVENFSQTDKIYLDALPVFDELTAIEIGEFSYLGALSAGQSVSKQKIVTTPNGIDGMKYIHVWTDASNTVFEKNKEDNNTNKDSLIVQLSPWPDLQVDTLWMLPDTAEAGDLLDLDFIVHNYGTAAVQGVGSWKDRIYISPNPVWNPADAVALQTLDILQSVPVGGTYNVNTNFILPMLGTGASAGICYIYVFADVTDVLFEHTDENNNVKRSNPIFVFAPPPVDFNILNATTLPDTVLSGQELNLQWLIRNEGSTTALWDYGLWYDGIYLCEDSVWHPDYEDFVKDFTQQGPLDNLETYSNSQNFNIPNSISGDYYAFLVADHTTLTNNAIDSNGIWKIRPQSYPNGTFKPIHIKLSPSPDLEVSAMLAPNISASGQPVQVIWTIQNSGMGATSGTWTDKIYLSTDFEISNDDLIVGTQSQSEVIPPNGSYTDTLEVIIPIDFVGNFVLILKTDANNTLFEFDGEDNNTFFNFLTTSLPSPCDLLISNITIDTMAMVGEQFPVQYTLLNQGTNPASGFMQELIYFSVDSMLDASDVKFVNPLERNINLAPAGTLDFTPSNLTPGVPLGDYFVIVQTDILNNIFENSDTNNITVSTTKVSVSVQELPLGSLVADTMMNNIGVYYRIEIPDSLQGETMLVTLDGKTAGGVNELYLSHEVVPTRSVHEFSFSNAFEADQEIVLPEIQKGTYYLLVYGATDHEPANHTQFIDLKAEIIPFSLLDVQATKGGNTGNVTLQVDGAKFAPDMTLQIEDPMLGTIAAHTITFINSTRVFATFNLAGAALGIYDVVAQHGVETATLIDAFEIVEGEIGTTTGGNGGGSGFFCNIVNIGTEEGLSKNIQHPSAVRVNRLVPITIQFGNSGNVDIPCPFRLLLSLRGAPISFDFDDFSANHQALYLEFQEPGGPPGILRPGATASVTVYAFSSHPLSFELKQP